MEVADEDRYEIEISFDKFYVDNYTNNGECYVYDAQNKQYVKNADYAVPNYGSITMGAIPQETHPLKCTHKAENFY